MTLIYHSLSHFRRDPLITVQSAAHVSLARETARLHGLHHLPVVDEERLVGVVCTCDMLHEPPDVVISRLMHDPVSLAIDDPVDDALEMMTQHTVGSVVLVEDDRPVGIVTRSDLGTRFSVVAHDPIPRCEKCGIRSHLRRDETGAVFCLDCASNEDFQRPGALLSV